MMPPHADDFQKRQPVTNQRKGSAQGSSEMKPLPPDFVPGENDVICSWARQNHRHSGNVRFRELVDEYAETYVAAETKYEKTKVIATLIEKIREGSPDGGFVKKDFYSGCWFEIGIERARDKVGHAVRKAADKLVQQKMGNGKKSQAKSALQVLRAKGDVPQSPLLSGFESHHSLAAPQNHGSFYTTAPAPQARNNLQPSVAYASPSLSHLQSFRLPHATSIDQQFAIPSATYSGFLPAAQNLRDSHLYSSIALAPTATLEGSANFPMQQGLSYLPQTEIPSIQYSQTANSQISLPQTGLQYASAAFLPRAANVFVDQHLPGMGTATGLPPTGIEQSSQMASVSSRQAQDDIHLGIRDENKDRINQFGM